MLNRVHAREGFGCERSSGLCRKGSKPPFSEAVLEDHLKVLEKEKQELTEADRSDSKFEIEPQIWSRDFSVPPRIESAPDPKNVIGDGTSLVV